MKQNIRVIALIFAALFIVFIALSLTFAAAEAHHDCAGEDCPVCEMIAFLSSAIRSFTVLLLAVLTAVLASAAASGLSVALKYRSLTASPVVLRVKLLN